jgi:hypothetical protein
MREALIDRRLLAVAPAALLALGAVALAGPRDAASAVKPGTVRVSVKTPLSQQALLSSGKVKARVGLGLEGKVRVVAGVSAPGGSSAQRISKPRVLSFSRLGTKRARLRLSASGRSLLADCSAKSLVVTARPLTVAQTSSGHTATATAAITIDSTACGAQGSSAAGGGGGGVTNGNVIRTPQPYTGPAVD